MESEENSYLQKIKKRAFDSGLDLMGLSTHQSFVSPDPNKRKENIELTKHQIEIAILMLVCNEEIIRKFLMSLWAFWLQIALN